MIYARRGLSTKSITMKDEGRGRTFFRGPSISEGEMDPFYKQPRRLFSFFADICLISRLICKEAVLILRYGAIWAIFFGKKMAKVSLRLQLSDSNFCATA